MESRDRKAETRPSRKAAERSPKADPKTAAAGTKQGVISRPRPKPRPKTGPTPGPAAAELREEAAGAPVLSPAPGRVAELRLAAADYVMRAIDCDLDDSEESLAFVDHYIDRVRSGGKLSEEVLQLVAGALGVYLGEVARTRFGGRWVALPPRPASAESAESAELGGPGDSGSSTPTPILDSIDDPAGWRLQLAAVPMLVDPIGMARSALQRAGEAGNGEADGEPDGEPDEEAADREENGSEPSGAAATADEDPVGFATTPALTAPLRAALARLPPVEEDYYYSLTGRFETLAYAVELIAEIEHKQRPPEPDAEPEPDQAPDA